MADNYIPPRMFMVLGPQGELLGAFPVETAAQRAAGDLGRVVAYYAPQVEDPVREAAERVCLTAQPVLQSEGDEEVVIGYLHKTGAMHALMGVLGLSMPKLDVPTANGGPSISAHKLMLFITRIEDAIRYKPIAQIGVEVAGLRKAAESMIAKGSPDA